MLRIIKFRGKQINTDEWVYGHLFYGKNEHGQDEAFIVSLDYYCRDGLIDLNTCASWQVDIDTVGQYTGLKDKNGKEIYEGDIVRTNFGQDFLVKWIKRLASFCYVEIVRDSRGKCSLSKELQAGSYEVEVIRKYFR